jgi:cytohesin
MNKIGKTPLIYAAEYGNDEMVELLLSKGVNVNEKGDCGNTPLHFASLDRWPDEMTDRKELKKKYWKTQLCLISYGANVNAKNDRGDIPLHYAVEGSDVSFEYVKLLISKGADVNARNMNGNTPLNLAKFGGNKDIIDLLRQHGAKK